MSKIEVNEIVKASGSTLTIGGCGTAVTLGSGATQSGFGRSGSVNWQTTPKTATFTAVSGEGYFINSGSAITMNLPAGSAGAIVAVSDYSRNFSTYNLTVSPNGSEKIGGTANDAVLNIDGQAATFVYVDGTKGWVNVQNAEDTEVGNAFISATGGSISTVCTNFKVHTFTSPGTFCVSAGSGGLAFADYLVIGGGGGGGADYGGGAGAGGYRFSNGTTSGCYSAGPSPLGASAIPISPGPYSISVGAGGAGATMPSAPGQYGGNGSNSIFSTITSAGGGAGGSEDASPIRPGKAGGSGGGGSYSNAGGSGNTPPTTPPQGNDGGTGSPGPYLTGGGGGGAGAVGATPGSTTAGAGGAGLASSITSSAVTRGGGGGGAGGGSPHGQPYTPGTAGSGGGGAGAPDSSANGGAGTANTGGGGGGGNNINFVGGAGGSGVVIIRYKFQQVEYDK